MPGQLVGEQLAGTMVPMAGRQGHRSEQELAVLAKQIGVGRGLSVERALRILKERSDDRELLSYLVSHYRRFTSFIVGRTRDKELLMLIAQTYTTGPIFDKLVRNAWAGTEVRRMLYKEHHNNPHHLALETYRSIVLNYLRTSDAATADSIDNPHLGSLILEKNMLDHLSWERLSRFTRWMFDDQSAKEELGGRWEIVLYNLYNHLTARHAAEDGCETLRREIAYTLASSERTAGNYLVAYGDTSERVELFKRYLRSGESRESLSSFPARPLRSLQQLGLLERRDHVWHIEREALDVLAEEGFDTLYGLFTPGWDHKPMTAHEVAAIRGYMTQRNELGLFPNIDLIIEGFITHASKFGRPDLLEKCADASARYTPDDLWPMMVGENGLNNPSYVHWLFTNPRGRYRVHKATHGYNRNSRTRQLEDSAYRVWNTHEAMADEIGAAQLVSLLTSPVPAAQRLGVHILNALCEHLPADSIDEYVTLLGTWVGSAADAAALVTTAPTAQTGTPAS